VLPQDREYYRLSTTVINAYLQPILARYIAQLDRRLAAPASSRGRNTSCSRMAAWRHLPPPPAAPSPRCCRGRRRRDGGVLACGMSGSANIITFDMGGTSCDVALIRDGEPLLSSRGTIEGRDLAVPMLDINTVSAGGGTVATVDRFGVLQVGPTVRGRSAWTGCYGRGGEAPTITDCNLLLGYLGEDNFLGGRMRLDAAKARAAIEAALPSRSASMSPKRRRASSASSM
jgi:N-methylhydantoinase A